MSFLFTVFDIVLTLIMLFDTLGMIYQFRKGSSPSSQEYIRLCTSWILFLTICSLFSCNRKGFFGSLFRLIFLVAKVYVTIPKLGGALKIYNFLIKEENAKKYYNQIVGLVKSKLAGKGKISDNIPSSSSFSSSRFQSETTEPEREDIQENQSEEPNTRE